MTFAELKTALISGSYSMEHIDDAQAGVYVNDARTLLDGMYNWPFLEASATGTAPLVVTDLATVEAVANETLNYPIAPASWRSLLNQYGDLSQQGNPAFFYVATPGGVSTVATFPTSMDTIGVQYWRVSPVLVNDSDTPLAPAQYHALYVDMAAQRAYMRTDNFQAAQALQPWIDQRLSTMVNALMGGQQNAGPQEQGGSTAGADDSDDGWGW